MALMTPRLPLELQEFVIEGVHPRSSDLKACALVSLAWSRHSRKLLFNTIRVQTKEAIVTICEFLDAHPELGAAVRSVTISPGETERDYTGLIAVVPCALLERLPNLRCWKMWQKYSTFGPPIFPESTPSVFTQCSSIKELHLGGPHGISLCFTPNANPLHFIGSFPQLQRLVCTGVDSPFIFRWFMNGEMATNKPYPDFSRLQMVQMYHCEYHFVVALLEMTRATLTTLTLGDSTNNTINEALSRIALRPLRIVSCQYSSRTTEQQLTSMHHMLSFPSGAAIRALAHLSIWLNVKGVEEIATLNRTVTSPIYASFETLLLEFNLRSLAFVVKGKGHRSHLETALKALFPKLFRSKIIIVCRVLGEQDDGMGVVSLGAQPTSLIVSPDGRWIAASSATYAILHGTHETPPSRGLHIDPRHKGCVSPLAFSPDGSILVGKVYPSKGAPILYIFWSTVTGNIVAEITTVEVRNSISEAPRLCAWSPDSSRVALGCCVNHLRTWDVSSFLEEDKRRRDARHGQAPELPCTGNHLDIIAFADDGRTIATRNGHEVTLWDSRPSRNENGRLVQACRRLIDFAFLSDHGRSRPSSLTPPVSCEVCRRAQRRLSVLPLHRSELFADQVNAYCLFTRESGRAKADGIGALHRAGGGHPARVATALSRDPEGPSSSHGRSEVEGRRLERLSVRLGLRPVESL